MRITHRHATILGGLAGVALLAGLSSGCSDAGLEEATTLDQIEGNLGGEDSLLQAFTIFKTEFEAQGEHQSHHVGFGHNPFLNDQVITIDQTANVPMNGTLTIDYVNGTVSGTLKGPKPSTQFASRVFSVWLVRNAPNSSVRPQTGVGDTWIRIGDFAPANPPRADGVRTMGPINKGLSQTTGVNFDFDFVVLTNNTNTNPTTNIVSTGARTIFEKRYFREKFGGTLDNPSAGLTLSKAVESKDTLVQRGHQLFFKETFAGNGRTCGTCHREEENLTINKTFIASLPANDPLFVNIAGLEDPTLLREGVIRENVDGFDSPTTKFVERSVPHTLGMSASIGVVFTQKGLNNGPPGAGIFPDGPPPDHKTGWSADGSPGRGTLTEFAMGAIFQHFPKSLGRVKTGTGASFRLPTQEELYSLEAFQLFTGPQGNVNTAAVTFNDAIAQRGRDLALSSGQCVACHRDIVGNNVVNLEFNTGIEGLPISFKTPTNMPKDGGFGTVTGSFNDTGLPGSIANGFGNGQFNTPSLAAAADTGPWFHNNGIDGLFEGAVNFYNSDFFRQSIGAQFVLPDLQNPPTAVSDIAAFLRTVNSLTNIAQVQKRTSFVKANRQPDGSNDPILRAAIEDTTDAINVLTSSPVLPGRPITTNATTLLSQVRQALQTALASPDTARDGQLGFALERLTLAKNALRTVGPTGIDF